MNLFFNDGLASFSAPLLISVGDSPRDISAGDWDADGDIDLATINTNSDNAIIFLNDGQSAFPALGTLLDENVSSRFALGDFDGDSDQDFVLSRFDDALALARNDGGGDFSLQPPVSSPKAKVLAAGDLDRDQRPEIISGSFGDQSGTFAGQLTVHFNDNLDLSNAVTFTIASNSVDSLVVGDVDGDQDLDVVAQIFATGARILRNDGGGQLTLLPTFAIQEQPLALAGGDLDGDSDLDLVSANVSFGITVLFNDGTGQFTNQVNHPGAGFMSDVAVGDLDGDGDLDVITAEKGNSSTTGRAAHVFENTGTGDFLPPVKVQLNQTPSAVLLADLDGDGDLDAALTTERSDVALLFNQGNGSFAPEVRLEGWGILGDLAAGHLHADGVLDLALANPNGQGISLFLTNP